MNLKDSLLIFILAKMLNLQGFGPIRNATFQVKCLVFHSIFVKYQSSKKSYLEAKKPGNSNERIKPRPVNSHSLFKLLVSGPEKYGSILYFTPGYSIIRILEFELMSP